MFITTRNAYFSRNAPSGCAPRRSALMTVCARLSQRVSIAGKSEFAAYAAHVYADTTIESAQRTAERLSGQRFLADESPEFARQYLEKAEFRARKID
jgi:hypothetical protein